MSLRHKASIDRQSTVSSDDWAGYYGLRRNDTEHQQVDLADFRFLPERLVLEKIAEYFEGGALLEVGAGDSDRLIEVCKKLKPKECYGLDLVDVGCDRLRSKAQRAGVDIEVVCADMFFPPGGLLKRFDFVMSFGVVEHFHELAGAVRAIAAFARENGVVFTLIPNNKRTIYGWLMRRWNRKVYDAHVMYDAEDLKVAHEAAGMKVLWNGYLVSSSFGILSWCFVDRKPVFTYWLYKQLTRVSKAIWLVESKIGTLKPLRVLSPYAVCIAKVGA